jgi:hypothetical protein
MPEEEKPPRRKPGPKPPRSSYPAIEFHLSPWMHAAMKELAAERRLYLEDVYREAAEHFLEQRARRRIDYLSAPMFKHATRVSVRMVDEVRTAMQATAESDHQAAANAFETAVRLYLERHGRTHPTT